MTERDVEHLIALMPTIAQRATNPWTSGFAKSILRQSRRARWVPSPKQQAIMARLADELFAHDADGAVIEEDGPW